MSDHDGTRQGWQEQWRRIRRARADRMRELEARMGDVEEINARLDERWKAMNKSLDELVKELEPLKSALNQGRGALAMILLISNVITAAIAAGITHWLASK